MFSIANLYLNIKERGDNMDEFLREINSLIYLKWIANQKLHDIHVIEKNNEVILEAAHSYSRIILYPHSIFEEEVRDRKTDKVLYYIHFQMANMKHAVNLFYEMLDCIYENCSQPLGRILLCCSGGMTTSLFASKMQTLAQLENRNYEINATGYGRLYEIGNDYDVILLAPQVSYLLPEVRMHLENVIVEEIPARYFARNEYKNVLDFALTLIEEENV